MLARSIRWCGFEPGLGHKNDKFCLPGVVFFSRRFSDLIYEMGSNALNQIEGPYYPSSYTNPHLRMQEGIFRSFKKSKLSVVRKNGNLKLVNCLQEGFHGNIVA